MIELLPHLLLALEALEEDDVALQLRVRDLERDRAPPSLSIALKIDAIPLRAKSSPSSY